MAEGVLFVGPLERVLYLRTVPALEGLRAPELAAIAQHARERFFPRGAPLFDPRRPAESVFLIVDGRVAVSRAGRLEPEAGPGETVGLLHLLARAPDGIDARALEDTQTLELEWDAQMDVSEEYFSVTHAYLRYFARLLLQNDRRHDPVPPTRRDGAPPVTAQSLNLVERALALARCPVFGAGNADSIVELASHVTLERISIGSTAWRRGDPAGYFLIIVSGSLRSGESGRIGPADTAGLYEALTESDRLRDVVAAEDVIALRIDTEAFLDILEDHFEMAVDVTAALAGRLLGREAAHTDLS